MPASPEVLIAGAGPSGLVLALTLIQNGVNVRIIDKLATPHVGQKGAGIMITRSLQVPRCTTRHSVGGSALSSHANVQASRRHKARKKWFIAERLSPKPPTPYLNGVMLGQDHLEAILRSHLARRGCPVEMETELIDFKQDSDKVVANLVKKVDGQDVPETIEVKFLAGTDGSKGVVRKHLGLKFLGETRDSTHFIVADIHIEGLDNDYWHMWMNDQDEQISLRPTERWDNVFTLLCTGPSIDHVKFVSDPTTLVKWLVSVMNRTDLKFGKFVWLSEFRPNIRVVDSFGTGRVFVAGDAAHVHSPTGGQGMNSSIQDAFNLGWKLAHVCKGLSPLSLLSTYSEERIPVIKEILQVTTQILNQTTSHTSDQTKTWQRGGALSQLGINYRWSSIVVDERISIAEIVDIVQHAYGDELGTHIVQTEAEVIRAGDRAPDAPGLVSRFPSSSSDHPSSLFQVFKATHHTALIFTKYPEKAADIAKFLKRYPQHSVYSVEIAPDTWGYGPHVKFEEVDAAYMDVHGYAYKHYGIESDELTIVSVRPDAVVGAVVFGIEGLKRYFDNIFL